VTLTACRSMSARLRRPGALPCPHVAAMFVCLMLTAPRLQSQTFDATNVRQQADLAATWLVHAGDDPAFARPDFDDSSWTKFYSSSSLHKLFPKDKPTIVWYRLRVKVSPDQKGLALKETDISNAYEIYSNGVRLIQVGQVAPFVPGSNRSDEVMARFPDSQISSGLLVIAVRAYVAENWQEELPGFYSTNIALAQESVFREHLQLRSIGSSLVYWLAGFVDLCLGLAALLLFSAQRHRREYLWLFLFATVNFIFLGIFYTTLGLFSERALRYLGSFQVIAEMYLSTLMYFAFVRQRPGWRVHGYLIAVSVLCLYPRLSFLPAAPSYWSAIAGWIPYLLVNSVILPPLLILHWRRGNREAGILLIPLLLGTLQKDLSGMTEIMLLIPGLYMPAVNMENVIRVIAVGPIQIWLSAVMSILSSLAMGLIILLRTNRLSRQGALLEGELAAAREVQQVLVPEEIETIPGFRVESAYLPAQQVGGDFFQILATGDDGLLVVVGDVAGKGLPAAMLVSVLVGAIRATAEFTREPAELLASLNERLIGRTKGGFSTTLVAHISSSGQLTIANAGHLSPYVDGRELELPGALPLGIVRGATYETTRFFLEQGSRLTLYSDGVVEAQNPKGELFGFDRAKAIATEPAAAIAEAAKRFGQSDDITVVTIERLATVIDAATETAPVPALA
jgi:sigma-B regulation protein RsbU (phosphoserine phosphatase)